MKILMVGTRTDDEDSARNDAVLAVLTRSEFRAIIGGRDERPKTGCEYAVVDFEAEERRLVNIHARLGELLTARAEGGS